jgi:hypothetical protein
MLESSAARGCRLAMPIGAYLTLATLATVLAAQAQIACTRQVSVGLSMAAMPGMDMSSMPTASGALSMCPVVLVLSIAAITLTLNATAVLLLDRGSDAVRRPLARYVVRQPFARTCACILALGAGAVGTMMAIDGNVPQGPAEWLSLGGIVLAAAVAATIIAIGFGRCVIAFTRRIAIVFEREIRIVRRAIRAAHVDRSQRISLVLRRLPLLAACHGLRAPPPVVR